jgi:hypothetical protein
MGFKINVNNILRYEPTEKLEVGKEFTFEKGELCLLADDIQIWLTKKDWTVLADIQVVSQTRRQEKTIGKFIVKHLYEGDEQAKLTAIFRRM